MQQPQPMIPVMSSFPHTNITTEQIQKYLDENKKLILAILDNQNLGKLAECAQYQAQLQKNLMYLAAIADAQPQAPGIPPPMAPHPAMQQGGFYMQNPQAAAMAQQPGVFPPKVPVQFSNPLQMMQQQQQLHQQQIQGQMNMRPGAASNGMHPTRTEVSLGGSSSTVPPASTTTSDMHGGSKQDNQNAAAGTESQGASAATHGGEASAEAK